MAASSSAQVTTRPPLKVLTPPFTANKGELLQKLRDRKFQDLDAQLNSYQTRFEKDALAEGNLAVAFEAFCSPDPALSPILDEWVAKDPNSYSAHLARAEYLVTAGYQARGDQSADETSAGQFAEINVLLDKAVKDAVVAIKLDPKSSLAYAAIIDAARGSSDDDMRGKAFAAGLKNVPLSMVIRVSEIRALQPRWGGSYGAMEAWRAEAPEICGTESQAGHLERVCRRGKGGNCVERERSGGGNSLLHDRSRAGGRPPLQHRIPVSRHVVPQTWSLRRRASRIWIAPTILRPQEPRTSSESLAHILRSL